MTLETTKIKAKLQQLTASLSELESQLEPLFSQSLPETLVGLEPIQQAKLQTALPYLVYDLVFIYLKTQGIDPKTHPVISELDRIKQYFDKIQNVENPPAKRTEIDKAAASRFIKHAITQAQWKKTAAEEVEEADDTNGPGPSAVQPKMTSKMLARAAYETELRSIDPEEEEDGLEVFDDEANQPASLKKRTRAAIDPFTGLEEEPSKKLRSASKIKVKDDSKAKTPKKKSRKSS